jgi:hypothetical protein
MRYVPVAPDFGLDTFHVKGLSRHRCWCSASAGSGPGARPSRWPSPSGCRGRCRAVPLSAAHTHCSAFGRGERHGHHPDLPARHWTGRASGQATARSRCALKDKFTALTICKGHKKSIVDLVHMLLRIIYAMLKNHTPCQGIAPSTTRP